MNGLSLFMALFFMSGRKNLRANDRFTVEFPAEVDYHGKKYYGVTGDASETGLSLIFSQSAYPVSYTHLEAGIAPLNTLL